MQKNLIKSCLPTLDAPIINKCSNGCLRTLQIKIILSTTEPKTTSRSSSYSSLS